MTEVKGAYHDLVRSDVFDIIPQPAGRVLDLGGGVGATGAALKQARGASHVVVADLVADHAIEEVDAAVSGNLEDLDFLNRLLKEHGPFDTILCLDVLEHLRDPWAVVDTLASGLAKDGMIVASIPNVNHHSVVLPLMLRGQFELQDAGIMDRTHIRWFTKETAIGLMTRAGLKLEAVSGYLGRKQKLFNFVTLGRFSRFMIMQYLIRVRRSA
ncbi:Methyltransferase domain-containing protein [Sphingomonas sp. OV641]|uniref:class I SAM-dependent methyltransferase n=1 Tax=unclassified Sphingomonas TaxID=196159 RepID=UPI00082B0A82|nr:MULTISPECIES: class I SAM-dependent methyltransferase [unclassified Sphingomonas]SEJ60034.1 Methyltransferase domain-containing protein [Sphingomonas sp. OV641]